MNPKKQSEKIITERLYTALLCFVLAAAAMLLIWLMDIKQQELRYYDTFSAQEDDIYLLSGARLNANGRYQLQLFLGEGGSDKEWMFTFIEFKPFTLYIDGQKIYQYSDEDGYQRVINVDLGDAVNGKGAVSIEIETDTWGDGNYLYLGPVSLLERIYILNMVLQTFEIGFLLAVLIYAVSLFRWKTSEKYLPGFSTYVLLLLIWSCCQLEFYPLVFNVRFFDYLRSLFNLLTILECTQATLILMNRMPEKLKDLMAWYNCLIVSIIYAWLDIMLSGTSISAAFAALPYILGAAVGIYLCVTTGKSFRFLATAFFYIHLMRVISYLADQSTFAESIFFNCFRTVPGFDVAFIIACMLFINRKFAGKFQESDELNGKLAESNRLLGESNQLLEESNRLLEESNQRLDKKVEERTAQLREQEQRRRQLMLNVFHDLRSPIFILRGYTEMMPAESEEAKENLAIMKEKLAFLYHLTEDLFLLSKLEENKIIFCEDPVDLSQLVYSVEEAAKVEADVKEIQITAKMEENCIVVGDYFRLEQAFQNIITNAIRYTPQGGHVEVRLAKEGEWYRVDVQDNGIGIPKSEIDKIFQLYYRRDRSSKSASTGLGLSITEEIIRHHSGTIEVESEEGKGSTFIVRLPAGPEMAEIENALE